MTHPTTTHLVTLFQDANYGGKQWGFDSSTSLVPADANDQASSFVIQPGYTATFYRDANFQNPILTTAQGANPWVGATLNDAISSLRIFEQATGKELNPAANYPLTLFQDVDYGGQSWGFSRSANVPAVANDHASSFVVAAGYRAELYRDANFQNPIMAAAAGQDEPWVGANVNDAVSSVRIFDATTNAELTPSTSHPVTLYRDLNYGGTAWGFDASAPEVDPAVNDQASSIVVADGFKCIAYPDSNYAALSGLPTTFFPSSNGAWLPAGLNDAISSLQVLAGIGAQPLYYREITHLSQLVVTFYTGTDDKDPDTGLDIEYFDPTGTLVASVLGYQPGGFSDHSTHSVTIPVSRTIKVDDARGGMLRVTIHPNGDDTWRFGAQLDLVGADGARGTVSSYFAGQSLETDHPQVELSASSASRGESSVQLVSPDPMATGGGLSVALAAYAEHVQGIEFSALYADDPNDVNTVHWHDLGAGQQTASGVWTFTWYTTPVIDAGNAGWGTVMVCASATDSGWPNLTPRVYHRLDIANSLPVSGVAMSFPNLTENANLSGQADLLVKGTGVHAIALDVFVTDRSGNSGWRHVGNPQPDASRTFWDWPGWDTTSFADQGSSAGGTVKFRATALGQYNSTAPVVSSARVNILNHPPVVVPNVVGMTLGPAATAVQNAGFVESDQWAAPDFGQPNPTVIAQNPAGGTTAPEHSTVTLTLLPPSTPGIGSVTCVNNTTDQVSVDVYSSNSSGGWTKVATIAYQQTKQIALTNGKIQIFQVYGPGQQPPDGEWRDSILTIGGTGQLTYHWNID